ncbi:hypothetical protein MTO96_013692 [Rhipicephalus appendiculatus]
MDALSTVCGPPKRVILEATLGVQCLHGVLMVGGASKADMAPMRPVRELTVDTPLSLSVDTYQKMVATGIPSITATEQLQGKAQPSALAGCSEQPARIAGPKCSQE